MNEQLDRIFADFHLDDAATLRLRLAFGHACVQRVRHFLEDAEVLACLDGFDGYLEGRIDEHELARLAQAAARLANRHPGSRSMDGCGHAAVSATFALAHAMAGKARSAAEYAAYAAVYGEGGYGAVSDPDSFTVEFEWQARRLTALLGDRPASSLLGVQ